MLKSDYTTKMIKQFNEAMKKINTLKLNEEWDEILSVIDSSFKEIFRLGSKFFNSLSYENILDVVTMNGNIEQDRCIIVAKFLEEEAEAFMQLNDEYNSVQLFDKSIRLFLEAHSRDQKAELEVYFNDIENICERVDYLEIDADTKLKLIDYFEKKVKYTKCEDLFYEIFESSNNDKNYIKKCIEFYKRLLDKSDEELESSDLPREEVIDGLNRLQNSYVL